MLSPAEIKIGSKALEYWKTEIKAGIRYRTMFGKSAQWQKYKNMYRGFWGKGVVPVNIMYALVRSLIPQVYFRNPRIGVIPMKPGYTMHARIWERIDNYLIRELWVKNELKTGVLDCFFSGRGPGILGYDSEYGFNPNFLADEYAEDSSLTSFGKKGERIEYVDNVKPGMPWFLRCNPTDFVVPWGTNRWEDARWFGFRKMRTLRDIKEDPKYKNKGGLKAVYQSRMDASTEGRPEAAVRSMEENPENQYVEVWQVHDKRTGRVMNLSLDHDRFLRDEYDYLQVENLPAHVLGFNEDPDFFWWTPDARLVEVQQAEINDIRTMAKMHRRVAILKVLYNKGLLKKDELNKLLDADPKAAVAVDVGPNEDIRKAVAIFQSHVPPDLIPAAAEVREDVREIIGFSRNQMGAFEAPGGRRTATEVSTVKAASLIRIDERRDLMADYLEKVVRNLNQFVAAFWTQERVIDVVGQDGAKYWVRFTGKEIKGEFSYKINPEEAASEDKATRRQEALQFIQLAMQSQSQKMDIDYLMETYASQFDWIDPKLLFPGEGPGRSPEKAMMFNDFMKMGQGQGSYPGLAQ